MSVCTIIDANSTSVNYGKLSLLAMPNSMKSTFYSQPYSNTVMDVYSDPDLAVILQSAPFYLKYKGFYTMRTTVIGYVEHSTYVRSYFDITQQPESGNVYFTSQLVTGDGLYLQSPVVNNAFNATYSDIIDLTNVDLTVPILFEWYAQSSNAETAVNYGLNIELVPHDFQTSSSL